ncbi:unnamed protein product [Didymodactylos carnosus]|uniref:Nocturnin n=1 Tax=Didymodactylos carnosus TaxID=1234261 RepID=A0A814DNE5_9BILA|nr:unnamed protein product [Didymodactylos carnosus]CAF3731391.1 unnamed protein product [Didymodactylos carnosus]
MSNISDFSTANAGPHRTHTALNRQFQAGKNHDLSASSAASNSNLTDTNRIIHVLQWNILAQALSYAEGNFIRVESDVVDFDQRKQHILDQILIHKPDLCSLEEMDIYEAFLKPELAKHNYTCYFTPKTNSKCFEFKDTTNFKGPDGILLMYKNDVFKEIRSNNFELPDDGRYAKQMVSCLELKHIPSQTEIVFIGTHLKAKKQFADSRTQQAQAIVEFIKNHYSKTSHILLAGDFNGERDEEFYKIILSCGFSSAYSTLLNGEPEFTTWKFKQRGSTEKEECRTIDYIFYNAEGFTPLEYLSLPQKSEIGTNALPSRNYPSDHLALAVKFLISPKK